MQASRISSGTDLFKSKKACGNILLGLMLPMEITQTLKVAI